MTTLSEPIYRALLLARSRQIARDVADLARGALDADVAVIWFGSWPTVTANPHADIDIAINGSDKVLPERLTELHVKIEEIATLHEIDLVDLQAVSEPFRQEFLCYGIRL